MNLYFLVEGRRTERKVYPSWLSHLLPHFTRVDRFDTVRDKNYFLISGEGYPSLLDVHLPNAVADFNSVAAYTHLVVCLDVDESTAEARCREVESRLTPALRLEHGELVVIAQQRTIETWFLGNRRIVPGNPQSPDLVHWLRFYDIRHDDPEQMGVHHDFSSHAAFHGAYLKEVFRERRLSYTKQNPGHVLDAAYLEQLLARIQSSSQLATFRRFWEFCRYIGSVTGWAALEPLRP